MSSDIDRSLGRIEGKLEALILTLNDHVRKDEEAWAKVNRIDRKLVWFSGAAAAVMFFGSTILKKIGLI